MEAEGAVNAGVRERGTALRWTYMGFGFIKPDNPGKDVFCHHSCIQDGNALSEGNRVEFVRSFDERMSARQGDFGVVPNCAIQVTGGISIDQAVSSDFQQSWDDACGPLPIQGPLTKSGFAFD